MKIIVWNSQDKCVADYHRLIRGCDVLCLLDCGQWTVPMYALQIQIMTSNMLCKVRVKVGL